MAFISVLEGIGGPAPLAYALQKQFQTAFSNLIYQPINDTTKYMIINSLTNIMQTHQSMRNIYDFQIVCDHTNNYTHDNKIYIDVLYKENRSINYTNIKIVYV